MKRRTNLFYSGHNHIESNFVTFSNYTEHLTGVVLATNFKLFPSRFICMHIPELSSENEEYVENKKNFIEQCLTCYYENKLAMLRDNIIADKSETSLNHPDQKLNYLGYLLDAIRKFSPTATIEFISTITEQDYNGTYTDIICTIDSSNAFDKKYIIKENVDSVDNEHIVVSDKNELNYLYGWSAKTSMNENVWFGPNEYEVLKPVFDGIKPGEFPGDNTPKIYKFISKSQSIIKSQRAEGNNEITFNIVIPLYDVVAFNPLTNETLLYNEDGYNDKFDTEETPYIDLNKTTSLSDYAQNVPYGIWFANSDIILKRDNYTKYAPSWSLLIGTQFKPFPNSSHLVPDIPNSVSNENVYATFAELLAKQTTLYDQWDRNFSTLTNIQNKIENDVNEKLAEAKELLNNIQIQSKEEITRIIEKTIYSLLESSSTNVAGQHKWEWVQSK